MIFLRRFLPIILFLRLEEEYWENLIPYNYLPPQKNYPPPPRTYPPPPNVPTPNPIILFLRLEEEYWYSIGFYDSKRSIDILQVFTTQRGVPTPPPRKKLPPPHVPTPPPLTYLPPTLLYCFYDSKKSIDIL